MVANLAEHQIVSVTERLACAGNENNFSNLFLFLCCPFLLLFYVIFPLWSPLRAKRLNPGDFFGQRTAPTICHALMHSLCIVNMCNKWLQTKGEKGLANMNKIMPFLRLRMLICLKFEFTKAGCRSFLLSFYGCWFSLHIYDFSRSCTTPGLVD